MSGSYVKERRISQLLYDLMSRFTTLAALTKSGPGDPSSFVHHTQSGFSSISGGVRNAEAERERDVRYMGASRVVDRCRLAAREEEAEAVAVMLAGV